jgi:hypothetical protein
MITKLFNEESVIQSVIFDKDNWSLTDAKKWLKDHDFKTSVDEKENTFRFRQKEPDQFSSFRTSDEKKPGLKFVYGIK